MKMFGILLKLVALVLGCVLVVLAIGGPLSNELGFALAGSGIVAIALESLIKYTYGLHK